jgi:outer membrane receptor protein involved in Fe transport
MRRLLCWLFVILLVATPAFAAEITGTITDRTGGALPGATVHLLNIATDQQTSIVSDQQGRFRFPALRVGIYRVTVSLIGFSDASRTVVIEDDTAAPAADFELDLGSLRTEVTVSAARGERAAETLPLRTDAISRGDTQELTAASTGDVLVSVPGVTPVGSGPFQVRPRLRGLDSTRVLVLVDGERLNNARSATDRAGVEVGLVDPDSIESIEVLGGAGSVLYGTDALSGTINIITNRPRPSARQRFFAGFDGYYSSNEHGRRGMVTVGASDTRWAVSFKGGGERFDNYSAGGDFRETSQPYFDQGVIRRADVVDDPFRLGLHAFPDPFNAPFTRTSAEIANSGMHGTSVNLAGVALITPSQRLDVKYQRRQAKDVGFPDFAEPFFFQGITLPFSNLDKVSGTYTATNVTPWLTKLTATAYYQIQDRLLRNTVPVEFAAPSAAFFPISVFRLDILSDTEQKVRTPGVDIQATVLTRPDNVLTAGATVFRDGSADARTTTTTMSLIGAVDVGPFGPAATVFPSPVALGPPTIDHPVRVPNASFADIGLFLQDEWNATPIVRLTGGLRVDRYRVTTDPTPGYDVQSLVTGAEPAIDPASLPSLAGEHLARNALTGEAGVVLWTDRPVSVFGHYVRSYRHPNLEELLFSGPATTGSIVPNVGVKPETGHNFDAGLRLQLSHLTGSVSYFNNRYADFISTEVVALTQTREGPSSVSQAINLAKVRIQGVEAEGNVPFALAGLSWLPSAALAYNRGTVLEGASPLSGLSLAGEPQDNITPWKIGAGVRVTDHRERWWASYNLRTETEVDRVSPLLSQSPFLIPQDLLGLAGFSVHRLAAGYTWRVNDDRVGLVVGLDNLTNAFYREQFQFAPARGRTVTIGVTLGGVR